MDLIKINEFFNMKSSLFNRVKEILEDNKSKVLSDEDVIAILSSVDAQPIVGSIIGYDEVDTSDRNKLWDLIK